MVRTLIPPLGGTPASSGAHGGARTAPRFAGARPSTGRCSARAVHDVRRDAFRPGFGLLIAAAASLALWAGLIWLLIRAVS